MLRRAFLPFLGLFFMPGIFCFAQAIENIKVSFDGQKVSITYDLLHANPDEKFKVTIFSSHDNFSIPLNFAEGDVGEGIFPGKSKKVIWNVKNVLPPDFDGDLTFKIRAGGMAAPKLTLNALDKVNFKRGEAIPLKWSGGGPKDQVTIGLYRDDVEQTRIVEKTSNAHAFTWSMSKKQKPGKGYTIRAVSTAHPKEFTSSQAFRIKPRIPFFVKALSVAAVGAVVFIVTSGGGDPVPPDAPKDEALPGPVKPK
jgi:hypothetical protein